MPDGVTAYNGHVDLGTGIATALAQIVAEELDLDLRRVRMVLGTIGLGPDQGATIASTTLQLTAVPLRAAAAQARAALLALAAEELGVPADALAVEDGTIASGGCGQPLHLVCRPAARAAACTSNWIRPHR